LETACSDQKRQTANDLSGALLVGLGLNALLNWGGWTDPLTALLICRRRGPRQRAARGVGDAGCTVAPMAAAGCQDDRCA